MPRVTRIAGSFAIVMIAYSAYALLAVPWIEPAINLRPGGAIPDIIADPRDMGLIELFPSGAWELKEPKVLECDRAKLLFQTYESRDDGTITIHPCTIVFAYEGPGDEAQVRRQSIILESPAGAVLKFDQKLNLNRAKIGRLVGGKLNGQVTIRSDWKEPGPQDDLRIVTSNIQLTEKTVSTKEAVDFRWGPHFGRGKEMTIKLLTGPPKPGTGASAPNISGLDSFELQKIERLHLDLGQTASSPGAPPNGTPSSVPIEITCRGPFRFDAIGHVATFSDQVDVLKLSPSGPADQIACELLSLYFSDRAKEKSTVPAAPKADGSLDLVAERIEAIGKPVVVTAPSQKVKSCGERLEYNLLANSITLDGGQEVSLQQGPNEIRARSLYYKSAGEGRLGQVAAQGPGWLRGQDEKRPDQQLEARWKDRLLVEPAEEDKQKHRISLLGGAELNFQGAGQLQAKEIYFWLLETPAANGKTSDLRPYGMRARNDVHMNSPELSATVEQLELQFDNRPEGGRPTAESVLSGSQNNGQPSASGNADRGMVGATPLMLGNPSSSPSSPPLRRFEVRGRLLEAMIVLDGKQASISKLTIEDRVSLVEMQPAQTGERPLVVSGDRLVAIDVTSPTGSVTVVGKRARFEGRGLGLTGSNINLNRGTNRLWIDGAGQMDLPMSGGIPLQGQSPVAPGGKMTVDWRHHMEFDGRTATFKESVVAATPQQQLRTDTMLVQMQRPISFSQPNMQEPPQVEDIRCYGGVDLDSRTADPPSHDQIHVIDLGVNVITGDLTAGGPGWLNRVFRGSPDMPGSPAGVVAPSPDQLNCLNVRFQKSVTGNVLRRQFSFADQVQMAYAPVANWDAVLATNDPDKLGPKGVVVRCDRLSVAEMSTPMGGKRTIELEASGNTVVEGTTFTATGNRITYAEAKSLLVLEGDGRNDARLFRQLERGGERSEAAARKIFYWPNTNRLKIDGARSLEIGQPAGGNIRR